MNTEPNKLRKKLHSVIFGADTPSGLLFDILLLIAIVGSIVVISLETVSDQPNGETGLPWWLSWLFTGLFTLEYLLRIYCVKHPLKYIFSFWGIIDLLSFLPDYLLLLPVLNAKNYHSFSVIRSLRLLRIFRLLNLSWFQNEAEDLAGAVWRARGKIIVFLLMVLIIVTVAGTVMYEVENAFDTDDDPAQITTIPNGIYWAIVTMTTVGFGDIVPVTTGGKFISAILILLGYSLIIVPTGFVSAEVIERKRAMTSSRSCRSCLREGLDLDANYCKYCGEKI
ncbi:MAG: ion transporter [Planctomycetota bacterium]